MMNSKTFIILVFCLICSSIAFAEDKLRRLEPISKDAQHPKRVNLKLMSDDSDYGYTPKKPILVGSRDEYGGPAAEREYLELLLDAQGKHVKFKRLFSGSEGPNGKPLDCYEVMISDGTTVKLWLSMYHPKKKPKKQPAPVGFYKKKG